MATGLPMSHKKDTSLILVKSILVWSADSLCKIRPDIGPDLDPVSPFDTLKSFFEKDDIEKNQQTAKINRLNKHAKLSSRQSKQFLLSEKRISFYLFIYLFIN